MRRRATGEPDCKSEPQPQDDQQSCVGECEYYTSPFYQDWMPDQDPLRAIHPNGRPIEIQVPTTPKCAPMTRPAFVSPHSAQKMGMKGGKEALPKATKWTPPEPPELQATPQHNGPPQFIQNQHHYMTGQEMGGGGLRPPHVASEQLGPASGLSLRLRPIWVLSKPGKEDEKKTGNQERAAPSGQVMAREPVEPRTTRLPARARIHRPKKQRARRRGVAHHRTRGKGNESHPTQIKWGQAP